MAATPVAPKCQEADVANSSPSVMQDRKGNEFPYELFMQREEIPVHKAVIGVPDVTALPRAPWARTGGNATFVELESTYQAERGMYIMDIPGGGELKPEKHLYEEEIFILEGQGVAQVWQDDSDKITFEWGRGSVFAVPPNTTHVFTNTTNDPVVLMGVTTAPRVMNALYDDSIIFSSDHKFLDLKDKSDNYFLEPEVRIIRGWAKMGQLSTHFIPNAHDLVLDDSQQKIPGGQTTGYIMGPWFPRGHVSAWPTGFYHKAHSHGPGAVLLGLDGQGYALAWDAALGARPYQNGHGDEVYKVDWGPNSIYAPPNHYYHQHFNTGAGLARHVAVYAEHFPLAANNLTEADGESPLLIRSFREGGTLIEYEDEDPQIRSDFAAHLLKNNLECKMEDVIYRD